MTNRKPNPVRLLQNLSVAAVLWCASMFGAIAEDGQRIVSIGGSVTEILYLLGKQDEIVAVDTTSVHPPEALGTKPNVGYMRALSAEGILSMNPSTIIALEGSGPPDVIDLLMNASVPVVTVTNTPTVDGVVAKIRQVAQAVGRDDEGNRIADKVRRLFDELAELRTRIEKPLRVMFVLSLQNGRPMVAGQGTSAEGILELAGAENAATGFYGFKVVTDEAVVSAAPDVVLMMQRGQHSIDAAELFSHPAFRGTPAAEEKRLVVMNGQYLLGFGPRSPYAARDLAARLYPSTGLPELESEDLAAAASAD